MPEITVTLQAGYEKVNPTNEFRLKYPPLYHQKRTYDELKTNDLVINTYNTGTGKTQASLLRLFDLKNEDDNVLFIAPTNELIRQHADDIRDFVEEHKLKFEVAEVTGKKLREWEGVHDPGYLVRNPKKLHEIIENPRDYFPDLSGRKKLILVTNPDIFYLCFYSRYSEMDSANLFRDFLVKFNYIVIDEFHYYNAKQLANFLMFFIFSKEYGYFNAGRKICLLSATPDDKLFKYLDKIDLKYKLVSPDNEQAESDSYEKVQTLSEIELTLHSGKIDDVLKNRPGLITDLRNSGKEGAVISSSLRTITDINQGLKNTGLKGKIGLITGAVDSKERGEATMSYPLVLATPTVDLGYNFKKVDKLRQNIDFVCFDALYGSEFTQRIGRTGRLLGKKDTTHRSIGHAFVQGKLYAQLQAGKSYDRREFAELVKISLGEDNRFYYYIQSYAVLEAFYPLYKHLKRVSEDHQNRVREVFETIREVFAPESDTKFDEIIKKIQWRTRYKN
ncbi:MAG: type I-D CRISPR-associated helicase Cas3', partial [Candidatus Poribacteria bacterium]|nr:type I-D CRISPR-associated helicase Cas3' [Candidatus Poribacteria bacterium]